MKKILILILVISLMLASFSSCKNDEDKNNSDAGAVTPPSNDSGDNKGESPDDTPPADDTQTPIDYLNDDLSQYISIDEKYYKGYTVTLDPNRVSVLDVENNIIQILCSSKNKESIDGDGIVSVGDVVDIYYKGYYMSDDEKVYFKGGSNEEEAKPYSLEIGSGGFIPGFEYNLIGVNSSEYADKTVLVETYFPEKYHEPTLAGVTAYFEVRIVSITEYEAPELDEAFITETLKITEDDLKDYEGDNIVEKFRSLVKEKVMYENGLDPDTLTALTLQNSILEGTVIKKMPSGEVDEIYNTIVSNIDGMYAYYQYYYTYDQLATIYLSEYYGIVAGDDWRTALRTYAEQQVTYMLAIFYIMDKESLRPTEEQYNTMFDEYLAAALEDAGITPDTYDTEEEYASARETYKNKLLKNNDESYFREMLYYRYVHEILMSYADVK